jgi:tetratricopeptide (TPR) repeat protein
VRFEVFLDGVKVFPSWKPAAFRNMRKSGRLSPKKPNTFGLSLVTLLLGAGMCRAAGGPLDVPAEFLQALEQTRDAQYGSAVAAAQELQRRFPQQPLSDLIAAEAYWGLIYCQTGRITADEIRNQASQTTSSYDAQFLAAVERALNAGRALSAAPHTAAAGLLYSGLAHGVRGRFYTYREQVSQTAGDGKQMRSELLQAVAHDPRLSPDADLGLGSYNYYADALSPFLKFIRFFMGIPGGDRQRGLEQLRTASQSAELFAPEARYELAHILGLREGQHEEALALFRDLFAQYPENGLYALAAGYEAGHAWQKQVAIEFFQKAKDAAEKMAGDCRTGVSVAAQGALERLRP